MSCSFQRMEPEESDSAQLEGGRTGIGPVPCECSPSSNPSVTAPPHDLHRQNTEPDKVTQAAILDKCDSTGRQLTALPQPDAVPDPTTPLPSFPPHPKSPPTFPPSAGPDASPAASSPVALEIQRCRGPSLSVAQMKERWRGSRQKIETRAQAMARWSEEEEKYRQACSEAKEMLTHPHLEAAALELYHQRLQGTYRGGLSGPRLPTSSPASRTGISWPATGLLEPRR
ncbi:hypothetical protein Naga_100409g6 [Nannochloropsis gaditana]|uniref:Uncharacterized protein n=1 Tax=Nannochloropsis gaditana TaxID=72520 RepID=W7U0W9_9STRA|nr:hypothetical protein Naga_100409g6 [Nannochloropsis gaditana]